MRFSFRDPIYGCKIRVFVESAATYVKYVGVSNMVSGACAQTAMVDTPTGAQVFIWLGSKPKIDYIVHEAFHATSYILREVGIPHTPDAEEAYAYFHTYVVASILKKVRIG